MTATASTGSAFAHKYGFSPLDEAGYSPLPPIEQAEGEDEQRAAAENINLGYELPANAWQPIPVSGSPRNRPVRFIDGSVASRTIGSFRASGQLRPMLLCPLGALELRLENGKLWREKEGYDIETCLCLVSSGIRSEDLESLRSDLHTLGIRLVESTGSQQTPDFEILRRMTWDLAKQEMESAERRMLERDRNTPALVDGLVERRTVDTASQRSPVVGMVKRLLRQYLPASYTDFLYNLQAGERSPMFTLETEHVPIVTWYLRLSSPPRSGPSVGLIRLSMPRAYLEHEFVNSSERAAEVSGLSAVVRNLRHRESSYARSAVSIEPIVRVEDELHALMPRAEEMAPRLYRLLQGRGGFA